MMIGRVLILVLVTTCCNGKVLELMTSKTRLPADGEGIAAVFDGVDSVYLFGMRTAIAGREYKYSISNDRVTRVGEFAFQNGGAVLDKKNGDVYYLGGYHTDSIPPRLNLGVWRVDPENPSNSTQVATLSEDLVNPSDSLVGPVVVFDNSQYVYRIGGGRSGDNVLRISTRDGRVDVVATYAPYISGFSAIYNTLDSNVYVFGGLYQETPTTTAKASLNVTRFNTTSWTLTVLNTKMPREIVTSCAVWTGKEAYIIGDGGDTLIRYDPIRDEVEELYVKGLPLLGMRTNWCTFVEALQRIYIFGGLVSGPYSNTIMYIDLDPKGQSG